jgi:hypothetical protein
MPGGCLRDPEMEGGGDVTRCSACLKLLIVFVSWSTVVMIGTQAQVHHLRLLFQTPSLKDIDKSRASTSCWSWIHVKH